VRAYSGTCPHQGVSLAEGELDGTTLTCRAHLWQFDAVSGNSINPTGEQLIRHEVRVGPDGCGCAGRWRSSSAEERGQQVSS
jgi:toluene monooxygenase system ferredoxin subunit